jgi:hypothetical protein
MLAHQGLPADPLIRQNQSDEDVRKQGTLERRKLDG